MLTIRLYKSVFVKIYIKDNVMSAVIQLLLCTVGIKIDPITPCSGCFKNDSGRHRGTCVQQHFTQLVGSRNNTATLYLAGQYWDAQQIQVEFVSKTSNGNK